MAGSRAEYVAVTGTTLCAPVCRLTLRRRQTDPSIIRRRLSASNWLSRPRSSVTNSVSEGLRRGSADRPARSNCSMTRGVPASGPSGSPSPCSIWATRIAGLSPRNVVRATQRLPRPRRGGADCRGRGRRVLQHRAAVMDALELLTDDDLAALAAALRSGRLHAPFTPVSLQQFCSPAHAGAMAIAATPRRRHEAGNFEADLLGVVQTAKQVDDC